MKGIILKADMTYEVLDKEWNLDDLQQAVGGQIESVPHPFKNTSLVGHGEAKYAGVDGSPLPLNMLATLICQSRLSDNDVICGDVVLLGCNMEDGETIDVSDFVLRTVKFVNKFVNENLLAN